MTTILIVAVIADIATMMAVYDSMLKELATSHEELWKSLGCPGLVSGRIKGVSAWEGDRARRGLVWRILLFRVDLPFARRRLWAIRALTIFGLIMFLELFYVFGS